MAGRAGSKDEERRGAEVLDELQQRPTAAERLLARLGPRGFSRPNVAVSSRIFAKYRVRDPWDPDPTAPDDPIALGPVSLKLGERRQVAGHLSPPQSKETRKPEPVDPIARFRPKPVGDERTSSRPTPSKPTPSKTAPRPAAPPPAAETPTGLPPGGPSAMARAFGARDLRQPLRRPIPMRPDRVPEAGPQGAPPVPVATPVPAPQAAGRRLPPLPAAEGRGSTGRYRMQPTQTMAPVVTEVASAPETSAEPAPPSAPEAPPRPRALPPSGDSLDDLFGMAAMGGRMTLGRRNKGSDDKGSDDKGPDDKGPKKEE